MRTRRKPRRGTEQHLLGTIQESIAALMEQQALTPLALSDKCGVHRSTVYRICNGQVKPSVFFLRKISIALGVSLNALTGDAKK